MRLACDPLQHGMVAQGQLESSSLVTVRSPCSLTTIPNWKRKKKKIHKIDLPSFFLETSDQFFYMLDTINNPFIRLEKREKEFRPKIFSHHHHGSKAGKKKNKKKTADLKITKNKKIIIILSSRYAANNMDSFDCFSPPILIIYHSWQIL